jgi:DHA1 family bicyclomycin/chloramphenicol resistance-like MFS transporter
LVLDLHTSEGSAQQSLMSFFIGLAFGQIVFGPVSDKVGRKPPIYAAMALFVLGSLGCALANSIEWLIAFRFVQGIGGSIGMVIGSAIVRDLYSGPAAVHLLSRIVLVFGVAPIVAPLLGSAIIAFCSWRAIFLLSAATGLVCTLAIVRLLPETRLPDARKSIRLAQSLSNYWKLVGDPRFTIIVMVVGLAQGGFFAYIAGSSFGYIAVHHLSPFAYSVIFGLNAMGLIGASQLTPRLIRRFGVHRLVSGAVLGYAAAGFLLFVLTVFRLAPLPAFATLLFVCSTFYGLMAGPGRMLALEPFGEIAGTAAALMGALQFACGAAASAMVGAFADGTTIPMVGIIAICGAASFLLCRLSAPAGH